MANIVKAGSFATAGEELAARELEKLPSSWIVICNKLLTTADGRSYEIDFIVIGVNWIFVLDEKSWRGKVVGDDQNWIRGDGSSERSPLAKIDYVAKIVAGHVRNSMPALRNERQHFVRGGVLLTVANQLPQVKDPRARDGIFLLSNVCQRLKVLDSDGGSSLVMPNHGYIRRSFLDLSNRPETPAQINHIFTIEDATTIRPGVRMLQAKLIAGDDPRNLMVYDLSKAIGDPKELREFYMREFKAIQELRSTGVVPDVKDPFDWSDDFLVVPIVPPPGKSLSALPIPESREELVHDIQIATDAFKALALIHQRKTVHRALTPGTIYVSTTSHGRKIMFTNFYAARVGDQSIAVSLDAQAIEDPYVAPELAGGYGFASPPTDTFTMALIFLERWSAVPLSSIRSTVNEPVILPNLQARWPSLPEDVIQDLSELFRAVLLLPPHTRPQPEKIAQTLGDIARQLRVEMNVDEGKMLDNRYQVERLLGRGAMASTYLALDTRTDEYFAVKHFLRSSDYEQAIAEFRALCKLSHRNLPRIYYVNGPEMDVHVIMEYVPGFLLSDVTQEFPWPIDRWWLFAQGLLDALDVLERHQLLHRDIKPENIILHEKDNHPVLIDFGFATPEAINKSAAGTPLYLPPEAFTAELPPLSMDRYATAVVLFKALTGYLPFDLQNEQVRLVRIPPEVTDENVVKAAKVLLEALATDPTERPTSTSDWRMHLQNAMLAMNELQGAGSENLEEKVNSWVDKLRGLYRNSEIGNADNRGLDSNFVRATYVETALDNVLLPGIFQHRPKAVFLSGNPGDGKTAFLERVQEELRQRGATCSGQDASGWEWSYDEHLFRSCYDASEAHKGQSADRQLTTKLTGLEGTTRPEVPLTVLVAINDGRLADYFGRFSGQFPWLVQQVQNRASQKAQEKQDVWLIDLKRRTFVNLPGSEDLSIFQEVLGKLVDEEQWRMCEGCSAYTACPIRQNAHAMTRARVTERLEYLLLLMHLSQQRHITMRDLRSALAFLITGNKSCADIHAARRKEDGGASLLGLSYWYLAFASAGQNDALLSDFAELDPARFAFPRLDRFLHFHQTPGDAEQRRELFFDKNDLSPQRFLQENVWMTAIKRKLYFDASNRLEGLSDEETGLPQLRWQSMLPYQYADRFVHTLTGAADKRQILEQIALGIARSDGITGKLPTGFLSVKVNASAEQRLMVLKQFPLQKFRLRIEQLTDTKMIESIPAIIVLEHESRTPRLEITLDLFELLMRMANGLQANAPEFVPLLEDLALFKGALLLQDTYNLVLIESGYKVHYITQTDGKIVRSPTIGRL